MGVGRSVGDDVGGIGGSEFMGSVSLIIDDEK
jgi:hypothetical protein